MLQKSNFFALLLAFGAISASDSESEVNIYENSSDESTSSETESDQPYRTFQVSLQRAKETEQLANFRNPSRNQDVVNAEIRRRFALEIKNELRCQDYQELATQALKDSMTSYKEKSSWDSMRIPKTALDAQFAVDTPFVYFTAKHYCAAEKAEPIDLTSPSLLKSPSDLVTQSAKRQRNS